MYIHNPHARVHAAHATYTIARYLIATRVSVSVSDMRVIDNDIYV